MESLKGKVVIVTGASSGIGAATAVEFARLGSRVILTGRDETNLQTSAKQCEEKGAKKDDLLVVVADMKVDDDIKKLVDATVEKFGQINVLVNNAAVLKVGPVQQIEDEDIDDVMNVNLKAVIKLTKLCLPYLKKTKGNIVNVSSVAAVQPILEMSAYCMSKAALQMLTKLLSIELCHDDIRVNSVNPGIIKTNIFVRSDPNVNLEEFYPMHAKNYPLGRVGEPEEVAGAITFLASDAASFMTGNLTRVDGGLLTTTTWLKEDIQRQPVISS